MAGTTGDWLVLCLTFTFGNWLAETFKPRLVSFSRMAWYRAVTPSSLKRAAIVPKTGICSVGVVKASLLRCTCLATSRRAS